MANERRCPRGFNIRLHLQGFGNVAIFAVPKENQYRPRPGIADFTAVSGRLLPKGGFFWHSAVIQGDILAAVSKPSTRTARAGRGNAGDVRKREVEYGLAPRSVLKRTKRGGLAGLRVPRKRTQVRLNSKETLRRLAEFFFCTFAYRDSLSTCKSRIGCLDVLLYIKFILYCIYLYIGEKK